jgi:putative transposase
MAGTRTAVTWCRAVAGGARLADDRGVSVAREILPGRYYLLTRSCTQRGFLLKPGRRMNQVFLYCLAEAAAQFGIDVILPTAMSNHHHVVLYDRHGKIVEFYARMHLLIAKAGNALRKRCENFWSSDPPCLVQLIDRADVLAKLVYTAINPVKDGLVERVHQWPGVSGLQALLKRRPIRVKRPPRFFDARGEMPAEVTLTLTVPPELERGDELRDELAAMVTAAEEHYARLRRKAGTRVLGRRAVLAQSWRDRPRTRPARRRLRPRVAARSAWRRIEALQRNQAFIAAYTAARRRWLAKLPVEFPAGTYWLRRFANVPVAAVA